MTSINDVIDGITIKLDEKFYSEIPKYTHFMPQNFTMPCFFISLVDLGNMRQLNDRWYVQPLFNVQYFEDEGINSYASKSLDVQMALQMIELVNGDKILSRGMNSVVQSDSLHCFMRFDLYLTDREQLDAMETLSLETIPRGE